MTNHYIRDIREVLVAAPGHLEICVSPSKSSAEVKTPGITYSDVNHIGRIRLSHIARLQDSIVKLFFYNVDPVSGDSFGGFDDVVAQRRVFLMSCRYDLNSNMQKNSSYNRPLKHFLALKKVGGSSAQYSSKTFLDQKDYEEQSTPLYEFSGTLVTVGLDHSRPMSLPESLAALRDEVNQSNVPLSRITHPKRPINVAHTFYYKASWSDTDENDHATMSAFVRFAIEGITDAMMKQKLICMEGDLATKSVAAMEMTYLNEIAVGDHVTMYVWEDDDDDQKLEGNDKIFCEIQVNDIVVFKFTLVID